MILGMPWITAHDARINGPRAEMRIGSTGTTVRSKRAFFSIENGIRTSQISAASLQHWTRKQQKQKTIQVFSASMADINKALAIKTRTDPRTKLPRHFHKFLKTIMLVR